jgi:hypothetical protein
VNVLVNNAGFGTYGPFASLDAGREHAEVMVPPPRRVLIPGWQRDMTADGATKVTRRDRE